MPGHGQAIAFDRGDAVIAQIDAYAMVRGLSCWFEVRIYDRGEQPTRNDPGCDPNFEIGRVFVDHDWRDPQREEVTGITDAERLELDAIASEAVDEHIQEHLLHY